MRYLTAKQLHSVLRKATFLNPQLLAGSYGKYKEHFQKSNAISWYIRLFVNLRKSVIFWRFDCPRCEHLSSNQTRALQKSARVFGSKAEKLQREALEVRPQRGQYFLDEVKNWLPCRRPAPDLSISEIPTGIPGVK